MSEIVTADESDWLLARAEEIRRLTRQAAHTVIRVGLILTEVKARLGAGRYGRWVDREFRWGRSTAERMVAAAAAFGDADPQVVGNLQPSALYLLARPTTPAAVRTEAVATAAAGRVVRGRDVRRLLDAATPARERGVGPAPRRPGPEALRAEGIDPADRPRPEDRTLELLAARALAELVEAGVTVRCSRQGMLDDDDPAGRPFVCTVYRPGREPQIVFSRDGALSALTLAAGLQPVRTCKACGGTFPVFDGFARKAGRPLDRSANCRGCDVARVGRDKKRVRGTLQDADPARHASRFTPSGKAERREAVRARLAADPLVRNVDVAAAVGCSEALVARVRAELEGGEPKGHLGRVRERVRERLTADPECAHTVVSAELRVSMAFVAKVRAALEAAGDIPRVTARRRADGVRVLAPRADGGEGVPDLPADVLAPGTLGASPPTREAVA